MSVMYVICIIVANSANIEEVISDSLCLSSSVLAQAQVTEFTVQGEELVF